MEVFDYASNTYEVTLCDRKRKSGKIDPPWNDGDTVYLKFDLGQKIVTGPHDCRVAALDAPETRLGRGTTPEEKKYGLLVKAYLNKRFPAGTKMWARTTKDNISGKYDRYLVELFYESAVPGHPGLMEIINFNGEMIKEGMAVEYGPGNWEGFGVDDIPEPLREGPHCEVCKQKTVKGFNAAGKQVTWLCDGCDFYLRLEDVEEYQRGIF